MDRISDSDSEDAGSIPAGATGKADIKRQADLKRAHWVSFEPACRFMSLYHPEAIDEGDLLQGRSASGLSGKPDFISQCASLLLGTQPSRYDAPSILCLHPLQS